MKYPRALEMGEKVRVYRNLQTGKLSVIGKNVNGTKSVIAHVENVALGNSDFIVSEKGRQRVLRDKRKNVHAFVEGNLIHWDWDSDKIKDGEKVTYNPYKYNNFVFKETEKPIKSAMLTVISKDGTIKAFLGE